MNNFNTIFISGLDYKIQIFDRDSYQIVRVNNFLDILYYCYNYQDEYYKIQKTIDFLRALQQNLFISYFTENYFKSLLTIPKLEIYKYNK